MDASGLLILNGTAGWGFGWHMETGLHILRLFAAGVFDRFPKSQIIIGHMGELLPFQLERVVYFENNGAYGEKERKWMDVWNSNIWVTTSGMFSLDPLACLLRNTKVEKVL
jgi:predicted TIM-barrel fold metal-dependent hydrolase